MATIKTFLYFSSALWNERCDALHGVSKQEVKLKKRLTVIEKVKKYYWTKTRVKEDYMYLFEGGISYVIGPPNI